MLAEFLYVSHRFDIMCVHIYIQSHEIYESAGIADRHIYLHFICFISQEHTACASKMEKLIARKHTLKVMICV